MQVALIVVYLVAVVLANLSSAFFGPSASIVNAFFLIGLTLSTRDRLHDLWGSQVKVRMFALIAVGGLLSLVVNAGAGKIALASMVAFAVSETLDFWVYSRNLGRPYLQRSNRSNLVSALSDSLIFPLVAFGGFLPGVVVGQFAAKFLGGFVWAWVLSRRGVK